LVISDDALSQADPAVTAGGSNHQFLVVWEDSRGAASTQQDVYGRRVTGSGGLLDGAGLRLSNDTPAKRTNDLDPDVAWNGSEYFVVYQASAPTTTLRGIALGPNGRRLFGDTILAPTGSGDVRLGSPVIASDTTNFLVAFVRTIGQTADVYGLRVRGSTNERDLFPISTASGDQTRPAIAYDGEYLVAWVDSRNGKNDIWGARIKLDDEVVDPDGFLFTDGNPASDEPAVTGGGGDGPVFTVAWTSRPAGKQTGVSACGIDAAPK
jgi:hypothetical protein